MPEPITTRSMDSSIWAMTNSLQAQRADKQIAKIARIHLFQKMKETAPARRAPAHPTAVRRSAECPALPAVRSDCRFARQMRLVTNAHTSNCATG